MRLQAKNKPKTVVNLLEKLPPHSTCEFHEKITIDGKVGLMWAN